MKEITPQLTETLKRHFGDAVARADAFPVETYDELMRIVAELSYLNRDHLVFFRGQAADFRNKAGSTSLYPSIYRKNVISKGRLGREFVLLDEISSLLVEETRKRDRRAADEIRRNRYAQWSLIQHYGVSETPLLDVTQSLGAACSFARAESSAGGRAAGEGRCFVYALALPYMSSGISIDFGEELAGVRLLSVCPPLARRPYFQEGFLVGTADITDNFDDKNELDFNRRLIAKFSLPTDDSFWGGNLRAIPERLLFPDEGEDAMRGICALIRDALLQAEGMLPDGDEYPPAARELGQRLRRRIAGK